MKSAVQIDFRAARKVWLVGNKKSPLTSKLVDQLKSDFSVHRLDNLEQVAEALNAREAHPHAVVIAIETPVDWQSSLLHTLSQSYPLLPMLVIEGPWLAGPVRRDRKPTGIARLAWHQTELTSRWINDDASHAFASRLQTPADRFAVSLPTKSSGIMGLAVVHTRSQTNFAMYAELASLAGLASVWQLPRHGVVASGHSLEIFDELRDIPATRPPSMRRILFRSFVTPDEIAEATAAGINRVIALPCIVDEAALAIRSTLRDSRSQQLLEVA